MELQPEEVPSGSETVEPVDSKLLSELSDCCRTVGRATVMRSSTVGRCRTLSDCPLVTCVRLQVSQRSAGLREPYPKPTRRTEAGPLDLGVVALSS